MFEQRTFALTGVGIVKNGQKSTKMQITLDDGTCNEYINAVFKGHANIAQLVEQLIRNE